LAGKVQYYISHVSARQKVELQSPLQIKLQFLHKPRNQLHS